MKKFLKLFFHYFFSGAIILNTNGCGRSGGQNLRSGTPSTYPQVSSPDPSPLICSSTVQLFRHRKQLLHPKDERFREFRGRCGSPNLLFDPSPKNVERNGQAGAGR